MKPEKVIERSSSFCLMFYSHRCPSGLRLEKYRHTLYFFLHTCSMWSFQNDSSKRQQERHKHEQCKSDSLCVGCRSRCRLPGCVVPSFLNWLHYPQKVVVFTGALLRPFTFSSGLLLAGSLHHFAK